MLSCHVDPFLAFVRDLQIEGCEVHGYLGPNTFGAVLSEAEFLRRGIGDRWDEENIYFLPGVRPGMTKRAADLDVLKRGMFTVDFDIRKELEKLERLRDVEDGDIAELAEIIMGDLYDGPVKYGAFRYAVLSGNGLHIHYFGVPAEITHYDHQGELLQKNKDEWSAGMKEILSDIAAITPIPPDFGCCNAGRIMRMPGSWNVKGGGKKPVTFLAWMPGAEFGDMKYVLERGAEAIKKLNQKKEQEREDFIATHPEGGSDVIDLMNQIPIEQVAAQLLGVRVKQVKKDGGMRFCDEKGEERGFFKHHQFNVIVHEGTSLFDPPSGTGYNCLGFVRAVKKIGTREAVQWFAERSARIRDLIAKEKQQWKEDHKVRELADWRKNIPPTFTPQ